MRATPGDHIVIETTTVDVPRRRGEVLEVIGQGDGEHYRVRWHDGHESVFFPGPDAHVVAKP
jgi:translation initiation factor IF-1